MPTPLLTARVLALALVLAAVGATDTGSGARQDAVSFPPAEASEAAETPPAPETLAEPMRDDVVACANLVYAGSKTSVCFSDKFLERVERETNIVTAPKFRQVRLNSDDIFRFPFAIMTGEGSFNLFEAERSNLKAYLTRGGFLLASAGCSSTDWDRSFRREIKRIFPGRELRRITLDHPLYHTVFEISEIRLSHGGRTLLEGLEIDGRIVLVYSPEGLNDTRNVGGGCCCCGGNEVRNCQEVNVNIITYALTH